MNEWGHGCDLLICLFVCHLVIIYCKELKKNKKRDPRITDLFAITSSPNLFLLISSKPFS